MVSVSSKMARAKLVFTPYFYSNTNWRLTSTKIYNQMQSLLYELPVTITHTSEKVLVRLRRPAGRLTVQDHTGCVGSAMCWGWTLTNAKQMLGDSRMVSQEGGKAARLALKPWGATLWRAASQPENLPRSSPPKLSQASSSVIVKTTVRLKGLCELGNQISLKP